MFFDTFQALCEEKGVSCTRAAKEMGLSNSITTKWRKTGATPGGETLEKVAAYFGVSTDSLLGKEKLPAPVWPFSCIHTPRSIRKVGSLVGSKNTAMAPSRLSRMVAPGAGIPGKGIIGTSFCR